MKIALICTEKLPVPPILGGAIQIYISNIVPILSKHHEITVFSLKNDKLIDQERVGNVQYVRVSGKTTDEYIKNIIKAVTDEYDLIHVFNRPLWISRLKSTLPNVKFSLSLHNEMFAPKKIDKIRAKKCIDSCEFITTVSQFIADDLKGMYPEVEGKVTPIYSAADIKEFIPPWFDEAKENSRKMREALGLTDEKVILFVGRFSPKKGAHILLQAVEKVMEAYPNTALVLVGSKWYGGNITDDYGRELQRISTNLKGKVIFTGFLPPSDVPKYFQLADIFVCASQWREPLARVHYEAMASGLPIITTRRGGNAEVIEENVNGFVLYEYDNPEVMAEKITYLLEHRDIAQKMAEMSRKLAEEKYNWNRVAGQLLALFNQVK
ncbi:spore coat protein SA [Anaerovirgula multivorans]|uniref:Spore coat protein SA n=1 Tax=Anaerovirgula multivorans TaxID=312168 RepID=A0A239DCT1_9FIRM|nr:glycosyltransferase family 4 protein [Anaerovirgula multivorans]SNS30139.1 spore coat protein SA [Anaerovirgula multivorans]